MKKTFLTMFLVSGAIVSSIALSACASQYPAAREETAMRIASPAWMIERNLNTGPAILTLRERMHERHAPANVYIEGDGLSVNTGISSIKGFNDIAPTNPVALHLASFDKAENVVHIARPCQYSGLTNKDDTCANYTGDKKFSPDVIKIYMSALNDIKARYDIRGFNLIGYDGGGAIATLLAAERADVISLRTVAGTLDTQGRISGTDSLNPRQFAHMLQDMPQYHFSGEFDTKTPASVYHSYENALGNTHCTQHDVVADANHTEGWVNDWPELLKKMPKCKVAEKPYVYEPIVPIRPPPIITPRDPDLYKSLK